MAKINYEKVSDSLDALLKYHQSFVTDQTGDPHSIYEKGAKFFAVKERFLKQLEEPDSDIDSDDPDDPDIDPTDFPVDPMTPPPVDRSKRTLTDGSPIDEDESHREIEPSTGMQKGYVVLSQEERAKGYVRPVRRSYLHKACGVLTTMGIAIAETYARDPKFYDSTYCRKCRTHFPLTQFVWEGTNQQVGS